jgi:glycosyl transferase family 25
MINCLYINLNERTDRNAQLLEQFKDMPSLNLIRFSAIRNSYGPLGCSLSHIGCIEQAKQNGWDQVLILEDDFELLVNPNIFINAINKCKDKQWDVMLLTGILKELPIYSNMMYKVTNAQTAVAYMVNKHYYDRLLENFRSGYNLLLANPSMHSAYSLDQYWKHLQHVDSWYIQVPILGKQLDGFSDNTNMYKNYNGYYLRGKFNRMLLPVS